MALTAAKLLVRKPLKQLHNGCRFSGTTRHVEYQIRLAYEDADPSIYLEDKDLVDQTKLKKDFEASKYNSKQLSPILEFAMDSGVPLWNGLKFKIDHYECHSFGRVRSNNAIQHFDFWPLAKRVETVEEWCQDGTVLATMPIFSDYNENNQSIYMGQGSRLEGNHTVVVLGLYRLNQEEPPYFIYHDSRGPEEPGWLGYGRNLGRFDLLIKIYKVVVNVPNELRRLR